MTDAGQSVLMTVGARSCSQKGGKKGAGMQQDSVTWAVGEGMWNVPGLDFTYLILLSSLWVIPFLKLIYNFSHANLPLWLHVSYGVCLLSFFLTVSCIVHFLKLSSSLPLIQVEKPKPIKCGTFGATSLQQRHIATGDFEGKLNIWYFACIHWCHTSCVFPGMALI